MADVLDYKKEYRELYLPKSRPGIITVPEMTFVAVEGNGDPNESNGEYKKSLEILYGIQYTIKMSKKGKIIPRGYFDYVVPPLEGLWWTEGQFEIKNKSKLQFISMIRLPEYVTKDVFDRACEEAAKKKKLNTGKAFLYNMQEGLCVQCLHIGSYNDEPKTLELIDNYITENKLLKDFTKKRKHHEIYLSNPQKTEPENLKTVLRIPVKNGKMI